MREVSMNRLTVTCCCLALVVALSGCENTRRALGMEKQAPDEFAVVTRAPLTIPPDFGLRPPVPGAKRPQENSSREQARQILLGRTVSANASGSRPSVKMSSGESAILKRAGALNPDPGIRQTVNRESKAIANADEGLLKKIIFWQDAPLPGVVVDAGKETRRLREASALGDAPNKGEVPVIKRKERGLLEGIF